MIPTPSVPLRVIVVDDDPHSVFVLRSHLKRDGHVVDTAESAAECLDLLQRVGPAAYDAVVSDYWMPGGNGLELLKQIKALDPTLSVLLATAEGEKNIVAQVLQHGGCGYLDKPVSGARLRQAVEEAAASTREKRSLLNTAANASALGASQRDLLLHHTDQLGDRLRLFFHAKAEASGDFVSVLTVDPNRQIILASDASGHDLRAAFESNYFHGVARGMIARGARIDEVFNLFNNLLLTDWNRDGHVYLSLAACGIAIDRAGLSLFILNCGFPFPFASDTNGFAYPLQSKTGSGPLGWFEDNPEPVYTPMPTGYLVLWTDGMPDLADVLEVDPLALTHRLLTDPERSKSLVAQSLDDIAAFRLDLSAYHPNPTPPNIPIISHRFAGDSLNQIDRHQAWFERSLRLALPKIADDKLADITICAREALINGLHHGSEGRADRFVDLQVSLSASHGDLYVRVTDAGKGHDFDLDDHEPTAAADLLTEHRGLVMMKHLPNHTAAFSRGACLAMDFSI